MRLLRTPSPEVLEGMLPNPATCLARLNSERLKKIARLWVGKDAYKLNKEGALLAVTRGLGDARAIRAVVAGLSDFERAGLGLIKARGGRAAYTGELVGELLMFDLPFPGKERHGGYHDGVGTPSGPVNALLDTGLVIRIDGSGERISGYNPSLGVFADAGVLAAVDPLLPEPLVIKPQPGPAAGSLRRPTEVLLECLALARVLRDAPPIPLTARGLRSKSALARIGKPLAWKEHAGSLPDALGFYLSLFEAAGLLKEVPGERLLALDRAQAEAALAEPYPEQARRWARAYRTLSGWCEAMPDAIHFYAEPDDPDPSTFNALRAALLLGLAALPAADAWYRVEDLSEAMFGRIGSHLALGFRRYFHAPYGATPSKIAALRGEWLARERGSWHRLEGQWIASAVRGPLHHLGLVELGRSGKGKGTSEIFRLTEAGRLAFTLHPGKTDTVEPQAAWVVQPNFDVVLYLEGAAPAALAFIDCIAERRQLGGDTAVYRLTRAATYRALESGLAAEALIRRLGEGSRHPLPEAVAHTLGDWAARRERLSVHRNARILEFASSAARDAALRAGELKGTAVGERCVLVQSLARSFQIGTVLSYEPALPRCLSVSEDGEIRIDPTARDLLITGELAAFSDPVAGDEYRWRMNGASVRRAVARGWSAAEILNRLGSRAKHRLPPLFECAVRARGGGGTAPCPIALPTVPILQVGDRQAAEAIAQSVLLRPYLASRLGPHAFLVGSGQASALYAKLGELGFEVAREILVSGTSSTA